MLKLKMHNQTLPMVNPYNGRVFGTLPDPASPPISPITSSQSRVTTTTIHRTDPSKLRSKDAASDSVTSSSSPIVGCRSVIPVHSKDQQDCDPRPQPFLASYSPHIRRSLLQPPLSYVALPSSVTPSYMSLSH